MLSLRLTALTLLVACYSLVASATTRTAANCTVAAIQAQVNLSADGDTVLVPGSTCNTEGTKVTWTTSLTINVGLTLNGQGAVIQFTFPGKLIVNADAVTNTFITGFTFDGSYNEACNGPIFLNTNAAGSPSTMPYRFFNNTLNWDIGSQSASNTNVICPQGWGPGVIDHNTFNGSIRSEIIELEGTGSGLGASQELAWSSDVTPGGPDMVFLEDNTFNNSGSTITGFVAGYYGSKYVARHNTLHGGTFDAHGGATAGATGNHISVRWTEVYQNVFTQVSCAAAFQSERGGSGVIWGNTISPHTVFDGCSTSPSYFLGPDCPSSDGCTGNWPLPYGGGRGIASPAGNYRYSPYYAWGNDTLFTGLTPQFGTTFGGPSPYIEVGPAPNSTACTGNLFNGASVGHAANVCDGVELGTGVTNPTQTLTVCQTAAQVTAGCPLNNFTYTPFTYPHPLVSGGGNPQAATPSCIPGAGTYPRQPFVSCSDSSVGAIMCFTTNGSTPATNGTTGCTTGTKYTVPFFVTATESVQVIAGGTGFSDSSVFFSSYTVTGDQYGGRLDINCATTTAFFHLEKISNRWWFCTPQGHGLIAMSEGGLTTPSSPMASCANPNNFATYAAKYGDVSFNLAWQTLKRLTQWGFNVIGQDTTEQVFPYNTCASCLWPGLKQPIPLPYFFEAKPAENASFSVGGLASPIKDAITGTNTNWGGFRGHALYDMFDPGLHTVWSTSLQSNSIQDFINLRNNYPYLLGVLTDDADFFDGSGSGPDYLNGRTTTVAGWTVLLTSPVQTYIQSTALGGQKFVYTTQQFFSKSQALNPATCSIAAPCSLRDYLKNEYTTIGALNTAWGSSYTTFDSTATQVTSEAFATGDGTTTVFTHTLAHGAVDPFSVLFSVAATPQIGDCPWFGEVCSHVAANTGTLGSPVTNLVTQASSTINYTTGAVTITFVTAPANGAAITVNYQFGGWMQGGTGLMDEDGSHTSWTGTNGFCLEGPNPSYPTYFSCTGIGSGANPVPNANANLAVDIDNWTSQYSARYFKTMHDDMKAVSNIPYFGLDAVGGYGAPAFSKFIQGEAPYVDGSFNEGEVLTESGSNAEWLNRFQYQTQYFGDLPFMTFNIITSQVDSSMSCNVPVQVPKIDFATQALRGQAYFNMVNQMLTTPSFSGTFPVVGVNWWTWFDFQQLNQGLVTPKDNAYDGVEAVTASVPCDSYYLSSTTCGGEGANYSNAITPITQANQIWLGNLSGAVTLTPPTVPFGSINVGSSASQVLTVTNTTVSAVTVTSGPAISPAVGTPAGDFSITTTTCSGTIAASGGTCTINVKYAPSITGAESATVSLVVNSTLSSSLTGTGIGTTPVISLVPAVLAFSSVVVNQSLNLNVVLKNTGNASLTLSSITQSGAGYSQTNNCPASLGASLSCTIQVNFAPLATGTASGSLIVVDNAAGSPHTVGSTGSGILVPTTSTGVIIQGSVVQ